MMDIYDLREESGISITEMPYCCLYLDDATLKAIGIDRVVSEYGAGDEVVICGVACVREVSEREDYSGEPRQCLELRFTSLGLSPAADEDAAKEQAKKDSVGARLYGD